MMNSQRLLVAGFEREADLLRATRSARERGWTIVDVYAPYAVHGLDQAMGLAPSRLPWICFACGLTGVLFALWFQTWSLAVSWPLNVGGRPWNSWPAYVPVAFEVMVLLAGFGVVIAFLLRCGLRPGKKANMPADGVTDSLFVLIVREADAAFDATRAKRLFAACNSTFVEEREVAT